LNKYGLVRVAVVSPEHKVADTEFNLQSIENVMSELAEEGVQIVVFPELCICGYTCADLFYQEKLHSESIFALTKIASKSGTLNLTAVVGLPVVLDGRIYNCAALVSNGDVLGIVPKSYLPTTKEYYEERWFTSGIGIGNKNIRISEKEIPFGTDLLFRAGNYPDCVLGVELCEDLWTIQPPSGEMAIAGATLIANLSASNELLGKVEYRRELVRQQSARCLAAYLYAGAGPGESTTDTVFAGHSLIGENGSILTETERFQFDSQIAIADIDLHLIKNERLVNSCYSSASTKNKYRVIDFEIAESTIELTSLSDLKRNIPRHPFVPFEKQERVKHCEEIFSIQSTALAKRLRHTGIEKIVIGVSGGLDSTLALLVAIRAFDLLKLSRKDIVAVMMPGFGSSVRTRNNSENLADLLNISKKIIPIEASVLLHFEDIGHDRQQYDVTYENSQARERTQILMDLANKHGALVLGTGDLSELALGWCTFNGDHMSMYHVNAGVPKTLVRSLIEWCAEEYFEESISSILIDICNTPITPELLPLENGKISQLTEDAIGPYELHDFFLFNCVRRQYSPEKIKMLANLVFSDTYAPDEVQKYLNIFYKRFFSQQFKRSSMPDGPKVGTVALSPRADWRMPSDALPNIWLD
jgi:NAD+ synthase (glutamine-hydrolysing)